MKYIFLALSLVVMTLSSACDKEERLPEPKSKEAKILKWKFGDKKADIVKGKVVDTIKATFDFGTDITALTAKATISPKATKDFDETQSLDYTKPRKFTITAEDDKTKKEYTTDIKVAKNDKAKISEWKFGDEKATISDTNISITLPFGTDITALTAKATLSAKATISPNETQSRDYTNPVKYTVTADDGTTTKQYTVTATIAKNDKAEILQWKFGDKDATISGTNITITLSSKEVTKLMAIATLSAKATISPDPARTDYTRPVVFTVTAEDGITTKKYTVFVKVVDSPPKAPDSPALLTFGNGRANTVLRTSNGDFIVAGKVDGRAFVVSFDKDFNRRWEYKDHIFSEALCIFEDGNNILVGANGGILWLYKQNGMVNDRLKSYNQVEAISTIFGMNGRLCIQTRASDNKLSIYKLYENRWERKILQQLHPYQDYEFAKGHVTYDDSISPLLYASKPTGKDTYGFFLHGFSMMIPGGFYSAPSAYENFAPWKIIKTTEGYAVIGSYAGDVCFYFLNNGLKLDKSKPHFTVSTYGRIFNKDIIKLSDGTFIFTAGNSIYTINKNSKKLLETISHRIRSIAKMSDGTFVIATIVKGKFGVLRVKS